MVISLFIAVILFLSCLGALVFSPILKRLPDHGLGFFPSLGLLVVSLPLFWLGHIHGVHLNTMWAWSIALLAFCVAAFLFQKKYKKLDVHQIPNKLAFFQVALWAICFGAYLLLRKHSPDIFGIEKIPDLSFLNSIYTHGHLPPENLFVSGQIINYYYYGFFQTAVLAWLSFLKAHEVFHLMTAFLFATSATAIASTCFLFSDLLIRRSKVSFDKKIIEFLPIAAAVIAVSFALLIGNAHAFFYSIVGSTKPFWYPNATRYIAQTIHEFPLYSLIIGDLHAHLQDLPNTLFLPVLVFLFASQISITKFENFQDFKTQLFINKKLLFLMCLSFGLSYATNSWNIFTNLLLAGFTTWLAFSTDGYFRRKNLINTGLMSLLYVLGAILCLLPFWIFFHPMTEGLHLVPPESSSPLFQLILIWFVHIIVPIVWLKIKRPQDWTDQFLKTWIILSLGLILFIELFYFKDIYSGNIRANTMFKIGLQIWLWLSVLSSILFLDLILTLKSKLKVIVCTSFCIFLLGIGFTYSGKALNQYLSLYRTTENNLDGLDFLRNKNTGELEALNWLWSQSDKSTVLLSGVADSFSEGGVLNAFSGMPTALTWFNHVWLWNGQPDRQMRPMTKLALSTGAIDSLNQRKTDIEQMYLLPEKSKSIFRKYKIHYVLISPAERRLYPKLNESGFSEVGKLVFEKGQTKIFEIENMHLDLPKASTEGSVDEKM